MKFSVERQPFLSELQLVTRAAATRSAIPALGGVMLQAASATALRCPRPTPRSRCSRASRPTSSRRASLLLPARLLLDIVRVADGDKVSIESASDQGVVKVTSQRASFSVRTLPAVGFPEAARAGRRRHRGAARAPALCGDDRAGREGGLARRDAAGPDRDPRFARGRDAADGRHRLLPAEREGVGRARDERERVRGERAGPRAAGAEPGGRGDAAGVGRDRDAATTRSCSSPAA